MANETLRGLTFSGFETEDELLNALDPPVGFQLVTSKRTAGIVLPDIDSLDDFSKEIRVSAMDNPTPRFLDSMCVLLGRSSPNVQ